MAMTRAEKRELRKRTRQYCAGLISNAENPGFLLTNGMYPDEEDNREALALISQEMHAAAKRVDWEKGDA